MIVQYFIIFAVALASESDWPKFSKDFVSREMRVKKGDRIRIKVGKNANVKYMPGPPHGVVDPIVIENGKLLLPTVCFFFFFVIFIRNILRFFVYGNASV
ncbi:unnamed protein product [Gongylonema pulchrum]|uniref:FeThRed_A domain-containing protein n=1 Tax=Gongylonema pulchrum TaxID=637853 RepID=A0A183CVT5_9BILA|nr:unnamed protein product [Gongylonema pulchrum]